MSADVGSVGRSVAPGTGRRCRGVVGCGRSEVTGRVRPEYGGSVGVWAYRDNRVDGRSVPHAFLGGSLPFSFAKKKRPHPLGNAVFYMKQGDGCGTFRIPHRGVSAPVAILLPPLFCNSSRAQRCSRSFWEVLLSEWNGYSAREGRDGDTTPRRPRFGALSAPYGALFRKGRGEAPAGARR